LKCLIFNCLQTGNAAPDDEGMELAQDYDLEGYDVNGNEAECMSLSFIDTARTSADMVCCPIV
jgi:hypothetical protein